MRSAVSSTPAQVRERKLGDLFEYEIEHPVTIKRNQSALVPIVLRSFEGRAVLLYNKRTREDNPMRCVELKNTTGLTLEGGPLTVLQGSSYVGEAMLDTIKPDEERLIPYAVELGVHVLDNVDSQDDKIHRVTIQGGRWMASYLQVRKTTYALNNKSDEEHVVYLEQERPNSDWTLIDTPEPHEVTKSYWRFRFTIAPKQVTQFVVRQRCTLQQVHLLRDFDANHLGYLIEQKHLDEKTTDVLGKIVELRRQATVLEEDVDQLQQETANVHKEQQRIQGNLQSLGDRSSEKDLRDRLVRTLNSQEDRLEAIAKEMNEKIPQARQFREEMSRLIKQLEYDSGT